MDVLTKEGDQSLIRQDFHGIGLFLEVSADCRQVDNFTIDEFPRAFVRLMCAGTQETTESE